MTTPLIGLIGRARSGKDTAAAALIEERGATRLAFADPLREIALAVNPMIGTPALPGDLAPLRGVRLSTAIEALGWERAKDMIPEVRRFLQRLGTEGGRAVLGENVWVDAAFAKVADVDGPVVFTDVRFPNEADAIREAGGLLVRVIRPGTAPVAAHTSETALDGYDVDEEIWNTGTVTALRERIIAAYDSMLLP